MYPFLFKFQINRDPRFDDLSGEYEEHVFKQAYSFLSDVKQRDKTVSHILLLAHFSVF